LCVSPNLRRSGSESLRTFRRQRPVQTTRTQQHPLQVAVVIGSNTTTLLSNDEGTRRKDRSAGFENPKWGYVKFTHNSLSALMYMRFGPVRQSQHSALRSTEWMASIARREARKGCNERADASMAIGSPHINRGRERDTLIRAREHIMLYRAREEPSKHGRDQGAAAAGRMQCNGGGGGCKLQGQLDRLRVHSPQRARRRSLVRDRRAAKRGAAIPVAARSSSEPSTVSHPGARPRGLQARGTSDGLLGRCHNLDRPTCASGSQPYH
jgi:hypothetical protein